MSPIDDPKRWPFDVDAVEKGSIVMTPEQVDEYSNAPRDSKEWRLAMLSLKDQLERGLAARGITGWTVCENKGALVVLSDADASVYNQRLTDQALRTIVRSSIRMSCVDTEQLNDEQVAEHERRLMRNSYLMQGIREAKKKFRVSARQMRKEIAE